MEPLKFRCPNPRCRKKLSAPAARVGKRAKCPKCGTVLRVTEGEPEVVRLPEPEQQPPRPQQVPPPPRAPVRMTCPSCRTSLLVRADMGGELITCPRCREFITVPEILEEAAAEGAATGEPEGEVELEVIDEEEPERVGGWAPAEALELEPLEEPERAEGRPAGEGAPRPLLLRILWPATATGWAVSLSIHVLILVLLALITVATIRKTDESLLRAEVEAVVIKRTMAPELGRDFGPEELPSDVNVDTGMPSLSANLPIAEVIQMPGADDSSVEGITVPTIGVSSPFGLRDRAGRVKATAAYGGSLSSENAVEAGLRWLASVQEPEGYWAGEKFGGLRGYEPALTGLSLMAFLGAGYTHRSGIHAPVVKKGLDYLVSTQGNDGSITRYMYNHGIGALALCEAYGMTRDESLKGPAQQAASFIVGAQKGGEGWRYNPNYETSDTSVTGWQLMALKSAILAGLEVPKKPINEALAWLESMSRVDGHVKYVAEGNATNATTAVGAYCRELFGYSRYSPFVEKPVRRIRANLPIWSREGRGVNAEVNFYYWYYATLALFNYGGEDWRVWNSKMRDILVDNQVGGGEFSGSWEPVGQWCSQGGRVYATAMAIMALEVYYRYLPLYEIPRDEFEEASEKSLYYGQRLYDGASQAWLRYQSMVNRGERDSVEALRLAEESKKGYGDFLEWLETKAELSEDDKPSVDVLEAEANYRLATLYYAGQDYDRTEELISKLDSEFPDYGDTDGLVYLQALVDIGRSEDSRLLGDVKQAEYYRDKAVEGFVDRGAPRSRGFEVLVWAGDSFRSHDKNYMRALELYGWALQEYSDIVDYLPRFPEVRLKVVECYVRMEAWPQAVSEAGKLTKHPFWKTEYDEAAFGLFVRIGDHLYLSEEEPGAAVPFYEGALRQLGAGKRNSDKLAVKVKLGSCYLASGKYSQAVGIYEELINKYPDSRGVLGNLAEAYKGAGSYEKAKARLIELQELLKRGSLEYLRNRYEIAEVHYLAKQYQLCHDSIALTKELYPSLGDRELQRKFKELEQKAWHALKGPPG